MSLAIQLDQIEIDNNSLNDTCMALLTLSKLDLEPHQYKTMLKPLAEFMAELVDSTSNALMNIDKASGGKA